MIKDYKEIFVSVLISVYNEKEEWLIHAIDSILIQTYTNFEFIILLDKPDNGFLWGILKKYEQKDKRIILIKNEQNIGLAASLNKGISMSKGDYIVRMDADDISVPKRIEILLKFMENHPEIGVGNSWIKSFGSFFLQNRVIKYPTKHDELEIASLYKTPIAHPASIIRRSVIDKFSPLYNIKCCRSQDYELWSRLMLKGIKFATVPKTLLMRRSSNGLGPLPIPYQIIHNQVSRKNIQQILNYYSMVLPDIVTKINIKELSGILKSHKGNLKRRKQLAVILVMYYISLDMSAINRMRMFLFSGDFFRTIFYVKPKLTLRIFLTNNLGIFTVNNICTDKSMLIF
jgi:glycosyltransferase involved in cell wall biosynthesis